eukprot:357922-Chlamydomonas_euryale.AAC.4
MKVTLTLRLKKVYRHAPEMCTGRPDRLARRLSSALARHPMSVLASTAHATGLHAPCDPY